MTQPVANCPNCGAKIVFRWSSSVQTVCDFCKSILVRTDIDLKKVGRSAIWPTFFKSISVRTRMLLQKSHTVCTLLDHRKTILAPQFGQLATGWVIADGPPGLREEVSPQSLAACCHLDS